jgi:hypothetical protein
MPTVVLKLNDRFGVRHAKAAECNQRQLLADFVAEVG